MWLQLVHETGEPFEVENVATIAFDLASVIEPIVITAES